MEKLSKEIAIHIDTTRTKIMKKLLGEDTSILHT
jgi:hypothetical protein